MMRTLPALSPDVTVRKSADMVRGNADISNVNMTNIGKDSIEQTVSADRGDEPTLKRHRLNSMAADEAMLI